jgi:hypothetical protein
LEVPGFRDYCPNAPQVEGRAEARRAFTPAHRNGPTAPIRAR